MVSRGIRYNHTKAFSFLSRVSDEKVIQTKEILKIVKGLKNKNSFLDIGAGSGDIFFNVAKEFRKSVAVEPGKRMLKILKEKKKKQRSKGIKISSNNWKKFYEKHKKRYSNHFDLIINVHTIYFFENKTEEIKKMLSLLNENGLLILIYGYSKNPRSEFVSKFRHEFLNTPYHKNETYKEIKENFGKNLRTKFIKTKFVLQDFKDLEKNHLSEKSTPTNYFLQFAIKKWFDELTPLQKNSLLKYLNPLKKGDKYIIQNQQIIQILRKNH